MSNARTPAHREGVPEVEALLRAAGSGERMGNRPKGFIMLHGRTLLERSCRRLLSVVPRALVAVPPDAIDEARAIVEELGDVEVVAGGATRTETTRRLLEHATAPWILVHDVVHPLTDSALILRVLAAAQRTGAAAATLRTREFAYGSDGVVRAGPGDLHLLQKPLAFRREALVEGFARYDAGNRPALSSEPGALELVALAGYRVELVEGNVSNLKLTYPEDLALADAVVAAEER